MGLANLPDDLEFPSDVNELKDILQEVEPTLKPIPLMRGHVSRFVDGPDMDLVFPRLWLGDCDAAMNKSYLLSHKITHVLNAAGNRTGPAPVKTGADFYKNTPIVYQELDLIDLPFANVARYFEKGASFIKEALDSGGVVLVHCRQGRSRSASVLAAYLMIHHRFSSGKAIRLMRENREIRPNNGFLQQLADFDLSLFRRRFEEFRNRPSSDSDSDSSLSDCDSAVGNESGDLDNDYETRTEGDMSESESQTKSLVESDGQMSVTDESHSRNSSINSFSDSDCGSGSDSDCDSDDEESDSESDSDIPNYPFLIY